VASISTEKRPSVPQTAGYPILPRLTLKGEKTTNLNRQPRLKIVLHATEGIRLDG
jgi:hypothetical protein